MKLEGKGETGLMSNDENGLCIPRSRSLNIEHVSKS